MLFNPAPISTNGNLNFFNRRKNNDRKDSDSHKEKSMAGLRKATRNDVAQVAARMGKTPFQEHIEKTSSKNRNKSFSVTNISLLGS